MAVMKSNKQIKLTLKCMGGPLGPNISFFASPVKTRGKKLALFLVIA